MKIDLNCDLGEGEPPARTRALMRWITSANVACGGHAGSLATMETCARLAAAHKVRLGAHPGLASTGDFGRGPAMIDPETLELLLLHQVSALERVAARCGARLHHIKLHGSLYHATEASEPLARSYLHLVRKFWPKAKIYALAGGTVARLARQAGPRVWEEAFADRACRDDGSLVPRTRRGALVSNLDAVTKRLRDLLAYGSVTTVSGARLPLRPQTLCIHSDTPNAIRIARTTAQMLRETKV